jgi:hypothetical protein
MDNIDVRTCTRCNVSKPVTEYSKRVDEYNNFSVSESCKQCNNDGLNNTKRHANVISIMNICKKMIDQ